MRQNRNFAIVSYQKPIIETLWQHDVQALLQKYIKNVTENDSVKLTIIAMLELFLASFQQFAFFQQILVLNQLILRSLYSVRQQMPQVQQGQ